MRFKKFISKTLFWKFCSWNPFFENFVPEILENLFRKAYSKIDNPEVTFTKVKWSFFKIDGSTEAIGLRIKELHNEKDFFKITYSFNGIASSCQGITTSSYYL